MKYLKEAVVVWERNIAERDAYFSQFCDLNTNDNWILIELHSEMPEFCKD